MKESAKGRFFEKNQIIKSTQEKVKSLQHNSTLSEEVVEEQKKELEVASNKSKKLETELKKAKDQYKINLETMQKTVGIVTQSNSTLKLEVSKQKDYIRSLEEVNAPDVVSENATSASENVAENVTETEEVQRPLDNQRVVMSKESTEHRCHACDKKFNKAADLDRHVNDKHANSECHMCNKTFSSRKQADDHICMEGELVPQVCEKTYCKKEFISSGALKEHIKSTHFGNQRSVCSKCGEISDGKNIKKHMESCSGGGNRHVDRREKSKEICHHWRRGFCNRGSSCGFSHVGRQDSPRSEDKSTGNTPCRNGPSCTFFARGRCNFEHHKEDRHQNEQFRQGNVRRQNLARGTGQRRNQQDRRPLCRDQGDCDRVPNCPNIHNMADFPRYDQSQSFQRTNRNVNHRNQ